MYSASSRMKKILAILLAFTLIFSFNMAFADTIIIQASGSIKTTDSSGVPNEKPFDYRADVWVLGTGFDANAPVYLKVTTPNGNLLGQSPYDTLDQVYEAATTTDGNGDFGHVNIWNNVVHGDNPGYNFTDNPGKEYTVLVSTSGIFTPNQTKSQNFRVNEAAVEEDPGSILITKTLIDTNDPDSADAPVLHAGITFYLFDSLDAERVSIGQETTDDEGIAQFTGLSAGTYYLSEEIPTDANYISDLNENTPIEITAGNTTLVTVVNTLITPETPGSIEITKSLVDPDSADAPVPHAGITFYLFDSLDAERVFIGQETTDDEGIAQFTGLSAGTYYLSEEIPTGSNYTSDLNENAEIVVTAGGTQEVPVVNTLLPQGLYLKVFKTKNGLTSPHVGVTFQLEFVYEENANGEGTFYSMGLSEWTDTKTTDADGVALFGPLAPGEGEYILTEVVPSGYRSYLLNNGVESSFTMDGDNSFNVTEENTFDSPYVIRIVNRSISTNGGGSYDDGGGSVVVPEEEEVLAPPEEEMLPPPEEEVVEKVVVPEVEVPLPKTGGNPAAYPLFGSVLAGLGMYLRRRL